MEGILALETTNFPYTKHVFCHHKSDGGRFAWLKDHHKAIVICVAIAFFAFVFVSIFISMCTIDSGQYQKDIDPNWHPAWTEAADKAAHPVAVTDEDEDHEPVTDEDENHEPVTDEDEDHRPK